ncbi:MAG: PilZ domain-containing protein [Elsteraceae bacterium]
MLVRKTTARRYAGPSIPRSDKRYSNPLLLLSLEGRCVYTIDWSFGGMKIAGVYDGLPLGKEVEGRIVGLVDEEEEDAIHFAAKVIRCDEKGRTTHLRFTMLSDDAFDMMERALVRRETPVP